MSLPPRPHTSTSSYQPQSYFAPPTPPLSDTPPRFSTRRPALSFSAMTWLSHKSKDSISSISSIRTRERGNSQSLETLAQPQPTRGYISEPFDARSSRPSPATRPVHGAPNSIDFSKRDLPSIPGSPMPVPLPSPVTALRANRSLRSSRSSPHLKSPTRLSEVVRPVYPLSPPASIKPTPISHTSEIPLVNPQPEFEVVLLSPSGSLFSSSKPSQILVTLDTASTSHKTTLATLTSTPSHLSAYFDTSAEEGTTSYPPSPFTKAFSEHLSSTGLGPTQNAVHVFLDRASGPYTHILAFLRSPTHLPRAVQLVNSGGSTSHDAQKIDTLLELRDEAAYLGMDSLIELCDVELKKWFTNRPRSGGSTSSSSSGRVKPLVLRRAASNSVMRETELPTNWAQLAVRTSLSEEDENDNEPEQETPIPDTVQDSPQLPAVPLVPTPAGLGIKLRSRSNSRAGAGVSVVPPASVRGVSGVGARSSSFLPPMTSPATPKGTAGRWI